MTTYLSTLDDIVDEMVERAHRMVWCNAATVDRQGRPRSRVVHPVWDGPIGWWGARRDSFKGRHLSAHPWVSLAYISDLAQPLYVDCHAAWADGMEEKHFAWELFQRIPPPAGYDPAPIYGSADHPNFGLLQLTPWRVQLVDAPGESRVWLSR
jgi:hypothetical protein